jgi:hypothetical protein
MSVARLTIVVKRDGSWPIAGTRFAQLVREAAEIGYRRYQTVSYRWRCAFLQVQRTCSVDWWCQFIVSLWDCRKLVLNKGELFRTESFREWWC